MFNALRTPTIEKRQSYNEAVLTYKALNNLMPLYIFELLGPELQCLLKLSRRLRT